MHANVIDQRVRTMRSWVKRREDTHKPWNADELWARIKQNWPTMPEKDQELVFQSCVMRNIKTAIKEGRI